MSEKLKHPTALFRTDMLSHVLPCSPREGKVMDKVRKPEMEFKVQLSVSGFHENNRNI